jgi:hypothetical protein
MAMAVSAEIYVCVWGGVFGEEAYPFESVKVQPPVRSCSMVLFVNLLRVDAPR